MLVLTVYYCRASSGDNQGEGVVYDNIRDLKPETKPYYQVLIDNRDFPYMVGVLSQFLALSPA